MSWALRRRSNNTSPVPGSIKVKNHRLSLELDASLEDEVSPPSSPTLRCPSPNSGATGSHSRPHSPINNTRGSPRVSQIIEEEPEGKNMRRTDKLRRLSSVLTRLQVKSSSRSHSTISIEPVKIIHVVAKFEPVEETPKPSYVEVEGVKVSQGTRQPRRHSKLEKVDPSIFDQSDKEEPQQHMTDKMAQAQLTLLLASSSEVKAAANTRELASSDGESNAEEDEDEDDDFEDFQPNWVLSSMDRIAQEEKRLFEAKYEVMQPLGSGNFSTVYAAKRKSDGKAFAVKKINKTVLAGKEELIRAEIEIHTALDHPNIAKVEDVYETHEEWNIVMQLADKGELFNYLCDNGALGERLSKDVTRSLLKAVAFIHKRNVIHRDLKPENILLQSEYLSHVLVADFGLSTMVKPGEILTKQCGSFEYAAPEVLSGTGYGLKADMWSVGVILYTMLCGYQPFQDDDDSRQLCLILSGKFTFHSAYWCFISEEAKDLVKKLLMVDPNQRLSAQEALKHPWFN